MNHVLYTPKTCRCDKQSGRCPVCDWGLGICSVCGKAEIELDGPCIQPISLKYAINPNQKDKHMATQKYPTALAVTLKDGRTAKITSWDPETNEYFVKPDTLAEGQTRIRSTKFTEAELDKLSGAPAPSGFTPKDKWPTTRTKATVILANGDTIEVMAFLDDGALSVDGHEHALIGKDGCFLDDHEIRGVTFHTAPEVVTATVVKPAAEKPKPAPVPQQPTNAIVPTGNTSVAIAGGTVEGYEFTSGDILDDPRNLEMPRLQLAQGVLDHQKKGWQLGDLMYADMILSAAKGAHPARIGHKAEPVEFCVLKFDAYWVEDVPFVEMEKGYDGATARTDAERVAITRAGNMKYPWRETGDLTGLVRKPDWFNDQLGLFNFELGEHKFGFFRMPFLSKTAWPAVVRSVNTAAKIYLKGRLHHGKFSLSTECMEFKNISAVPVIKRLGTWDEATILGITEILRGFQQK